jgi:hypothetical protein
MDCRSIYTNQYASTCYSSHISSWHQFSCSFHTYDWKLFRNKSTTFPSLRKDFLLVLFRVKVRQGGNKKIFDSHCEMHFVGAKKREKILWKNFRSSLKLQKYVFLISTSTSENFIYWILFLCHLKTSLGVVFSVCGINF